MTLFIAGLALIVAVTAWRMVAALADSLNEIRVRLDRLERVRHLAQPLRWVATIKVKGQRKPLTQTLTATNEGDALRQLLVKKINPSDVLKLEQERDIG